MKNMIYNPIVWITMFWVMVFVYGWINQTFKFEGSWKNLDKSIHWRN